MGLIDWFKRGVGEMMVARPDDAKAHVVWKHPDPTIPMKAQLTVESDEVAVFFRDGKVVGQLGPGRHTLETDNIPFLSNLVDKFTGGNGPVAPGVFLDTPQHPREQVRRTHRPRRGPQVRCPGRDHGPR